MSEMLQFFGEHLILILVLVALALALTIFVFRKQLFDPGYRKGEARNPDRVKRENPPDEWSQSH